LERYDWGAVCLKVLAAYEYVGGDGARMDGAVDGIPSQLLTILSIFPCDNGERARTS
jgi:hypothetical protein